MRQPRKVRIKVATLRKLKKALLEGDASTAVEIVEDCLDLENMERVRIAKRELYEARESGAISPALYDQFYAELEALLP